MCGQRKWSNIAHGKREFEEVPVEETRDTEEAQCKDLTLCHIFFLILQDHKLFLHVISELFICSFSDVHRFYI